MLQLLEQFWTDLLSELALPLWQSIGFWRYSALVLVTALALLFKYRDRLSDWLQPRRALEHDQQLFLKLDKLLPEHRLRFEFDNELFNHHTSTHFDGLLTDFVEAAQREENQFINGRCRVASRELMQGIRALQEFMLREFHATKILPNDTAIIRLRPELNIDLSNVDGEGMHRYHELGKELGRLVNAVDLAYRSYRQLVKKYLTL